MKFSKFILLAVIMTASIGFKVQARPVMAPKAYMFGFIANFTDSVVYFTDIQTVDSVWYDHKTEFLQDRSGYANQLRNHFANEMNMPHRTCVVMFSPTRKDIEKKYLKLKKQYTVKHSGKYDVKYLNENEFHFTSIQMEYDGSEQVAEKPIEKLQKEKRPNNRDGRRLHRR